MKQLKIYRKKQLCELLGFSSATLYRMVKAGSFPNSIRMSEHMVGWLASDVDEWLHSLPKNKLEVREND
jgi:prophage regulatory protein